mmetsp:Transcript_63031/g.111991  ORF Transcript_63031/g.111991 Transcript_63031/m.111991 type:complete len:96 (+) Transcript_63031:1199-1486(+)
MCCVKGSTEGISTLPAEKSTCPRLHPMAPILCAPNLCAETSLSSELPVTRLASQVLGFGSILEPRVVGICQQHWKLHVPPPNDKQENHVVASLRQ